MKTLPLIPWLLLCSPTLLTAQSYTWTTLAGLPPPVGSADGPAGSARYHFPSGLVADPAGNLFVCDAGNHTIRRVAPDGSVTTVAGLAGTSGSADGTGTAARFFSPQGIAIDAARNLYVTDRLNHTIRKITPAGVVSTLAGFARGSGSSDGAGQIARFNNPYGIALAPDGNLYVADRLNHVLRKVTPAGVVSTFAGLAGTSGTSDGEPADARFTFPSGLVADTGGTLYLADSSNYTIRKITASGSVSTLAGSPRLSGTTNGTGSGARFNFPLNLTLGAGGEIFVTDTNNDCIRRVTATGVVTVFAGLLDSRGSANGTGTVARFFAPAGITRGPDGNLYVADTFNHTIRRITPGAAVSNFSGPGGNFGNSDGFGPAARFSYPHGLGLDGEGNLYLADSRNAAIRRITPEGQVSTHVRLPSSNYWGLWADKFNNLLVTDRTAHTVRLFSLDSPDQYVDVGTPGRSGSVDGDYTVASFNQPFAVAQDPEFLITYVADTGNHVIRQITFTTSRTLVVSTLAGTAGASGSSNGTGASARFNNPQGIAVDRARNVYVADSGNHTIRKITPAGVVTTLAGSPGIVGSTNATGAAARFSFPHALAVDSTGTVFVSDLNNQLIRRISPAGDVTTIGGVAGGGADYAEGTGAAARFNDPSGIVVGPDGAIYVVQASSNVVMKGVLDSPPVITAPPQPAPVLAGSPVTFAVGATGGGLNYQWRLNGTEIPGATASTYTVPAATPASAGSYSVSVSNSAGSTSSNAAVLSLVNTTDVGRIVNLAIRSQAGTGASTLIVGVGIGGHGTSGRKPVLLRSVGPALTAFGVPGALADPKLELYSDTSKINENDNWGGDPQVAAIGSRVGAFSLGAATSRDAALYVPSLAAGSYTVQMTGTGGATGVVLAEIYDATPSGTYVAATPRLTNVSARTDVGAGGDILIAGFTIGGFTAKTVLIRAIGPTLGLFGVPGALADPKLELYAGSSAINQNDNWGGGSALAAAFSSVGAFPLTAASRDAALLVALAPGSYTVQVSGVNNGTGVALVEVYEVP